MSDELRAVIREDWKEMIERRLDASASIIAADVEDIFARSWPNLTMRRAAIRDLVSAAMKRAVASTIN